MRVVRSVFLMLWAAVLAATSVVLGPAPPASAETPNASIRDVGLIPNTAVASYGSYVGEFGGHGVRIWMAVNGSPTTVAQVDPTDNSVDWQLELPGADGGSWAVTASPDGTVFVGTWPNGTLYRKKPSEPAFTALGKPTADATWIWALTTDEHGGVYGGSYSTGNGDGHVFGWTPDGGFRDYGAAVANEAYVRSIAASHGVIYAGTGPNGRLVAVDAKTGKKREIPWPTDDPVGYVHALRVVGRYLYVHLGGSALVYDTAARQWNTLRSPGFGRAFSNRGPGGLVYADGGDSIVAIDARGSKATIAAENPLGGYLLSMRWIRRQGRPILLAINKDGLQVEYDPGSGATRVVQPPVVGAPVAAHSLASGPDGKVYAGGYMIGGLTAYDPASDTFDRTLKPIAQIEGMGSLDGKLYLGTYAGAVVYEYDPAQPWQVGTNPRTVLDLGPKGQDRPFAFAAVGDRMAIGTVPDYGKLGGTLSLYDPATGTSQTWEQVVTDQSVVSLASADGVIYGGTSVYGGLGGQPTQRDGTVFAFDPGTGRTLWQEVPVPGERAVTGLSVGPDGAVYGMAGGSAFRIDPATHETRVLATITTVDWPSLDHYWADGYLRFNPTTGHFDGSVRGIVFDLDPDTGAVTRLATGTSWFLQDESGQLYWTVGNHLIQATLPSR